MEKYFRIVEFKDNKKNYGEWKRCEIFTAQVFESIVPMLNEGYNNKWYLEFKDSDKELH